MARSISAEAMPRDTRVGREGAVKGVCGTANEPKGYRDRQVHPSGKFLYAATHLSIVGRASEEVGLPSGKVVYGSNRRQDSIAIFSIDEKSGELTPAGHQRSDVNGLENFGIDPTGRFLLVANQDPASFLVFRIDAKTGALEATGEKGKVGTVCVKFVPKAG
jgi:hypothetical protein